MKVTAAVVDELHGPFRIEQLQLDEPGPGEALVKIIASGVCHTDEITRHGDLPMPFPSVLGHEGAGEVGSPACDQGTTWSSGGRRAAPAGTAATESRGTARAWAKPFAAADDCWGRGPGRLRCTVSKATPYTATSSGSPRSPPTP